MAIRTAYLHLNVAEYGRHDRTIRAGANNYVACLVQSMMVHNVLKAMDHSGASKALFGRVLNINLFFVGLSLISISALLNIEKVNMVLQMLQGTQSFQRLQQNYPKTAKLAKLPGKISTFLVPQMKKYWLRRSVYLIHDSVGTVSQAAVVATSLFQINKGKLKAGYTGLTITALDLSRQYVLPYSMRSPLNTAIFYSRAGLNIVYNKGLDRIIMAVEFAVRSYKDVGSYFRVDRTPPLVGKKMDRPLQHREVKINPEHIRPPQLPIEPDINMEATLMRLYGNIEELPAYSDRYLLGLDDDDLRKAIDKQPAMTEAQKLDFTKAHIKDGLIKFVRRIINRDIREGDLNSAKDYDNLRIMAKLLTVHADVLENTFEDELEDNVALTDLIVQMGLTGHYCGTGYFREIGALYQANINLHADTLNEKLLGLFRDHRLGIVRNIMEQYFNIPGMQALINFDDVHTNNIYFQPFCYLAGEPQTFGVLAELGPTVDYMLAGIIHWGVGNRFGKSVADIMKRQYTSYELCRLINENFRREGATEGIPYNFYEDWFANWFSENEEITVEEGRERYKHEVLTDYQTRLKDEYILAMLTEMGITKGPGN